MVLGFEGFQSFGHKGSVEFRAVECQGLCSFKSPGFRVSSFPGCVSSDFWVDGLGLGLVISG